LARTSTETEFIIGYAARKDHVLLDLNVVLTVADVYGAPVFSCTTAMTKSHRLAEGLSSKGWSVCRVRELPLIPGRYLINIELKDGPASLADQVRSAGSFVVIDGGESGIAAFPSARIGSIFVPHEWKWREAARDDAASEVSAK